MNAFTVPALPRLAALFLIGLSLTPPVYSQGASPGAPRLPIQPPAAQQPSPAIQKVAKQWNTAVALQKAKKYDEAVAAYKEFLKQAQEAKLPANAAVPAYQNLVVIYRGQGKAKELEDALQKWAAADPKNAAVHAELCSAYASPGSRRFDAAAAEAKKALALKPAGPIAAAVHMTLGIIAVSKQDWPAAEQEFGSAAKLVPNNAQVQYNYGLALSKRQKFVPALAAMTKAATLEPKMTGARYYVALLNEQQQKYPEALAGYKAASALAPSDPTIHFDMARVQLRLGDTQGAITSYLIVLAQTPQSLPARLTVAELYAGLKNWTAAKVHFALAQKLAPKDTRVLLGLAQSELELAFQPQEAASRSAVLKQAEEHYKEAAALDPKTSVGPNSLAHFYERTGGFDHAQEIYRKRMEADPKDYNNFNRLAQVYIMQRKPDEAIAVWRKYRDLHLDDPNPYARVAETLESQGKWMDAVAEWKLLQARKLKIGASASVMVNIAKDLVRAKQKKDAVTQLEAVLKLDATGSDVPKEMRVAEAATVHAERLEAMRALSEIAESDSNTDDAVRWLQQVKAEEAAIAERAHTPPNGQTYRDIARLYQQAKKYDLAIKELDALTQIKQRKPENYAPAYEAISQIYESQNKMDDAISAYRKAAQFSKEPLNYRLRIAEDYQRSNRLSLAIKEYEAMQKDFPNDTRVMAPLALAYRQNAQEEDALKVYDKIIVTDPRARWALDQKASILTHLKRFDAARAVYEEELQRSPENRQLYADVAFVFQSEGKPDAFLDWVQPRYEKSPGNTTLMAVVADEYARQKKEDAGWAYLRGVADKHQTERLVLEGLASLMAQRNRREDALSLYRLLATRYPKDLNTQMTLADQLFAAGRKDESAKLYAALIARTDLPKDQRLVLRRQYARICAQMGNPAEELAQLQEIVKADPNDFDSATTLAQRLEAAGRQSEAIPIYQSLATKEVYDATVRAQVRCKIAALYEKMGQKADALAQYREAIKLNPNNLVAQEAIKRLGG